MAAPKVKLNAAQRDRVLDRVTRGATPAFKQFVADRLPPQASDRARTAVARVPQLKASAFAAPGNQPPPPTPTPSEPSLPMPPSPFDRDTPSALNRYLDKLDAARPPRTEPTEEVIYEDDPRYVGPPSVLLQNQITGEYTMVDAADWAQRANQPTDLNGTRLSDEWAPVGDQFSSTDLPYDINQYTTFDLMTPGAVPYDPNVPVGPIPIATNGPTVPRPPIVPPVMSVPNAPRLVATQRQAPVNEQQLALARFFGLRR